MAKLKQYYLNTMINDVEVDIVCATNSKKNFAVILDKSANYVNDYASNGIVIEECIANPHKLYCMRGLGGETLDIFEKGKIYEYDEAVAMIKEHRKTYTNRREWYDRKTK